MPSLTDPGIMDSSSVPTCYLCGSQGVIEQADLPDLLAGTPGKWNLQRCPNPDCGLVWLDPMPTKEDVWKAYRIYFTHPDFIREPAQKNGLWDGLLLKIHKPLFKLFQYVVGMRKAEKTLRKKMDLMFLDAAPPQGILLDVGCGKGDLLVRLRSRGWTVEGLEVDAEAAELARAAQGLDVYVGKLEDQNFPDHRYDVITMNHVIEHVHDPVALLQECLRVLKPGGRLVLATPNINSFAYKKLGGFWAHLDPPRHLRLFTKRTLKECALKAGSRHVDTWCVPVYDEGGIIRISIDRRDDASGKKSWAFSRWLETSCIKVRAYYLFFVKKDDEAGDEIFLMTKKDK